VRGYQKAQTVEAIVVAIDPERERISLSVKQLAKDPFSTWIAEHPKGSIVRGLVREVDAKGAIVDLGGGIDGYLRLPKLTRDRVEDARAVLKVGDEVEASSRRGPQGPHHRAVDQGEGHGRGTGSDAELPVGIDHRYEPGRPAQGADLRPVTRRCGCGGGRESAAANRALRDRSDCGESLKWTRAQHDEV